MASANLTPQHKIAMDIVSAKVITAVSDIFADLMVLVKHGPNEIAAIAAYKIVSLMKDDGILSFKAAPLVIEFAQERLHQDLDEGSAQILKRVVTVLKARQPHSTSRLEPSRN